MNVRLRSSGRLTLLGSILLLTFIRAVSPVHSESPHFVYLPLVYSPGPLLPNGDFEAGESVWTPNPAGEQLIFSQDELPPSYLAHSGSHVAWLGNHNVPNQATSQSIRQQIQIPESNPVLYFWLMSDSEEHYATSQDRLRVLLDDQLLFFWALCAEQNTYTWRRQSVNLNGYAGKWVSLTIQVTTNAVSPSEVYLDDFSFSP